MLGHTALCRQGRGPKDRACWTTRATIPTSHSKSITYSFKQLFHQSVHFFFCKKKPHGMLLAQVGFIFQYRGIPRRQCMSSPAKRLPTPSRLSLLRSQDTLTEHRPAPARVPGARGGAARPGLPKPHPGGRRASDVSEMSSQRHECVVC